MSNLNDLTERSKFFLHDLASPLVVLSFVLKKLVSIQQDEISLDPEKYEELLKKANDAVEKMKNLHADHKMYLSNLE